jgi:hypothetical protein
MDKQRWEYAQLRWHGTGRGDIREVTFSHEPAWGRLGKDELEATLKRLGDDAWEMVGVSGTTNWSSIVPTQHYRYLFKRPLQ